MRFLVALRRVVVFALMLLVGWVTGAILFIAFALTSWMMDPQAREAREQRKEMIRKNLRKS
jgi:hypothetical protein